MPRRTQAEGLEARGDAGLPGGRLQGRPGRSSELRKLLLLGPGVVRGETQAPASAATMPSQGRPDEIESSVMGICVRPAGLMNAARASSATATKAPPIPAGREPIVSGFARQSANTGSSVWPAAVRGRTAQAIESRVDRVMRLNDVPLSSCALLLQYAVRRNPQAAPPRRPRVPCKIACGQPFLQELQKQCLRGSGASRLTPFCRVVTAGRLLASGWGRCFYRGRAGRTLVEVRAPTGPSEEES